MVLPVFHHPGHTGPLGLGASGTPPLLGNDGAPGAVFAPPSLHESLDHGVASRGAGRAGQPRSDDAALIRFAPVKATNGFDETAAPAWQMVPLGARRDVRLVLPVGAAEFTLRSSDLAVASFRHGDADLPPQVVRIEGRRPGNCTLEVCCGGRVAARLDVAVRRNDHRQLVPFTVEDPQAPRADTTRGGRDGASHAHLTSLIRAVNQIFEPQANITFSVAPHPPRALALGHGEAPGTPAWQQQLGAALANLPGDGIPLVLGLSRHGAGVDAANASRYWQDGSTRAIVIPHGRRPKATSLAHQIASLLTDEGWRGGLPVRGVYEPRRGDLMFPFDPRGSRLTRRDVALMNRCSRQVA